MAEALRQPDGWDQRSEGRRVAIFHPQLPAQHTQRPRLFIRSQGTKADPDLSLLV